jgi:hypothetical protein
VAYLKIDDNAPHHAKMLKAGPAACWLWVCGLSYCQRHSTDGFIPDAAIEWLGVGNPRRLASFLVSAGLWHRADGGWTVHDYLAWNESAEERKAKTAQKTARQRAWRDKNGTSTRRAVDASTPRHGDAAPTPTPTPTPPPTTTTSSTPASASRGLTMADLQADPGGMPGRRRIASAAFEHPRFDVPQRWHETRVGGIRGGAEALRRFYAWAGERATRTGETTLPRFEWLDARLAEWLAEVGDGAAPASRTRSADAEAEALHAAQARRIAETAARNALLDTPPGGTH